MQYTFDPEPCTDIPLLTQLAGGVMAQWEKSAQDKTFRQRVLQTIHGKPLRIGKVKAVAVSFFAFRFTYNGIPHETAFEEHILSDEDLQAVFDLSVRVASNFDQPVIQVCIPYMRKA